MSLVRWQPGTGLQSLMSDWSGVDRLFDNLSRQMFGEMGRFGTFATEAAAAPTDVLTRGDDLVVRTEIPGRTLRCRSI